MRKSTFGGLAASILLLQLAGLSTVQTAGAGDAEMQQQKGMQRAAQAPATGPAAIGDISGTFQVNGKIRKKTPGFTSCTCYVYFNHDNNQGGDYYTYANKTITDKNCKMNVPFRFANGDTGRPVIVSLSANCTGPNKYRYFNSDLPDIPLKSGNSKVVKFDIHM